MHTHAADTTTAAASDDSRRINLPLLLEPANNQAY